MANPFADLVPAKANPFADLLPSSAPVHGYEGALEFLGETAPDAPAMTAPDFAAMPGVRGFVSAGKNLATGAKSGASGSYRLGANALGLVNKMADYLTEKTGVGVMSKDSAWGAAEQWLRDAAARVAPDATEIDDTVIGKIYQGLGSAPYAIGEYGIGSAVAGPVAGFAAVDALREADKGLKEAFVSGVKGGLLGGAFKGAEPLTRGAKALALAVIGGTTAAAEGGDISDVTAGAATLGILGAATPGGRTTARQAVRDVRDTYAPLFADIPRTAPARVEPTLDRGPTETAPEASAPVATPEWPTEAIPPMQRPAPVPLPAAEVPRIAEPAPPALQPAPRPPLPYERGTVKASIGDPGTLPRRVPQSQEALTTLLNEADAKRLAPEYSPEVKAEALRLQQDAKAELEAIEQRLLATDYGRLWQETYDKLGGWSKPYTEPQKLAYTRGFMQSVVGEPRAGVKVNETVYRRGYGDGEAHRKDFMRFGLPEKPAPVEFRLRTARGQETRFTLSGEIAEVRTLREELAKKTSARRFQSRSPKATETMPAAFEETLPATAYSAPGAAYTGFVRDRVEAGAEAPAKTPLRREDILRPLMQAFGTALYQGRIQGKKTLGFFRRPVEEVRIKRANDIETTAHEIAHLMDSRVPEIRKQWTPASKANAAIRDELRGVSYDAGKLYEGFAEFVRLWSTQREQARAKAPQFFKWFEDFVSRSEYGPALRKAQGDMHAWFAQDAVDRARSKVGAAQEINAGLVSVFDRFRQSVTDDFQGIYRMERELTGGIAPAGAYETSRLTRAKYSILEGSLLYGAPKVNRDGSHSFTGDGLAKILDPVSSRLDDFLMYAVGRSARELMMQGRERLFTPAEVKGMVALETPDFRTAFEKYQEWNRAILDFAQAKGIISPVARSAWRRADYLPFHRVGQPGAFSAVPGDWRGIKALTGGTENLRDVLGNMIGNAAQLIDAALTNEARVMVANLAAKEGAARFMVRIPTEDRLVKVHRMEVERQILSALGVKDKRALPVDVQKVVDQIIDSMEPMVPFVQKGQAPGGGNVVAVLRGGKPEYFEVADPLLFRSMVAFKRPTKNWLVKALSIPRRIGQSSVTLAFDFMAANIARDTLMGSVMSRHGFKPFIDSARGMASRIMADQNYREFVANGGGFSSYLMDETAFKVHLERFYSRKGVDYRTVLDSPAKLLLGLERIADAFEMSTRLGEFRQAMKRGEHPRHAAYSAREVSTDFAMRGDSAALGFLYDTVMFLKAGVNGMDRLYRGVAHDPNKGAIAAKTALIALLSAGLYGINRGNPLYEDLEDWDRDTHWHFFVPTKEALEASAQGREVPEDQAYHHFRYPKIWEIGAVASIAERSLAGLLDGQPKKVAGQILDIVRQTFRFDAIPQAVSPLYELATNRESFTGRPIETAAMQDLQPWARSGPYTSPTIRTIGEATRTMPEAFQVSPARVEALLRGYLNTWALYGLSLSDAMMFDDRPDMRVDQYPVLRRFYEAHPAKGTRHLSEMYDAIEEATRARRTMRFMDQTYRPEIAGQLENDPRNLEFSQLSRADQRLRAIRKEIEAVLRAPTISHVRNLAEERAMIPEYRDLVGKLKTNGAWNDMGKLKRVLMDDLVKERNEYAKRVMTDVKASRREMGNAK